MDRLGVTSGPKYRGRGGVRHLHYQKELKDFYESRNFTVEVESHLGNVTLDLFVIDSDGSRLGLQIMLTTERTEAENAAKALGAGIEKLLFVVETKSMMDNLRSRIEATIQDDNQRMKIGYKLVGDYLGDD